MPLLYDRYDDNEDTGENEKRHLRAGVRVNSRVKVCVERQEEGRPERGEGQTMDISAHGCMAVVSGQFEVGEKVVVTNLINQKACEAVLVWRGHQVSSGWELGLRLKDPGPDFWELEF